MNPLVFCQPSLSPFLVSLCNLEALCWCEKAVVVSCWPAWRPPASPIHPGAFPGGCLCVECSTPWSLRPNGVWERGLGFFSLCSAVQTCCHTAALALSLSARITISPLLLSVHLSAPFTICHITFLSFFLSFFHCITFYSPQPFSYMDQVTFLVSSEGFVSIS